MLKGICGDTSALVTLLSRLLLQQINWLHGVQLTSERERGAGHQARFAVDQLPPSDLSPLLPDPRKVQTYVCFEPDRSPSCFLRCSLEGSVYIFCLVRISDGDSTGLAVRALLTNFAGSHIPVVVSFFE